MRLKPSTTTLQKDSMPSSVQRFNKLHAVCVIRVRDKTDPARLQVAREQAKNIRRHHSCR